MSAVVRARKKTELHEVATRVNKRSRVALGKKGNCTANNAYKINKTSQLKDCGTNKIRCGIISVFSESRMRRMMQVFLFLCTTKAYWLKRFQASTPTLLWQTFCVCKLWLVRKVDNMQSDLRQGMNENEGCSAEQKELKCSLVSDVCCN